MSEEEYMECSVVAYPRQIKFLHINGGAISYYVDRHVSDYVDRLQQENKKQKELIDKAVLELANIDGNLSNSQLSDRICNLIDMLKG